MARGAAREDVIAEVARQYCERYAPDEMLLLELCEGDALALDREKAPDRKYSDALGMGIWEDVALPTVIFVLKTIAGPIVAKTYKETMAKVVDYLCDADLQKIDSRFRDDQRAKAVVAKLREMLCGEKSSQ